MLSTAHVVASRLVRAWRLAGLGLAGLIAALLLVAAQGFDPRPAAAQPSPTHIVAQLGSDCLEGFFWPGGVQVNVELRDSDGNALLPLTTATTDPSGHFVVNPQGQPWVSCDIPVTGGLRPGMTYTASHGSTRKSLLIEAVSFDRLEPETQTAAGTAPADRTDPRVQVSIYWNANAQNVYFFWPIEPDGKWSVNVAKEGGRVEPGSQGDAFLADDGADGNVDFTKSTIWVTALSLNASPAGAASSAITRAAGATVGRGARVRLSGRLSAGTAKACVSRKRVQLLKLAGRRSRVLESARTTKEGRYSFLRTVPRTTRFRVRYRGSRVCQRSKSRVTTVRLAGRRRTR